MGHVTNEVVKVTVVAEALVPTAAKDVGFPCQHMRSGKRFDHTLNHRTILIDTLLFSLIAYTSLFHKITAAWNIGLSPPFSNVASQ
jgi:hypothetical protein